MDHVVVDVEIKRTIEETPGGWDATDKLGVSCAVVYEYQADRFRVYGDSDAELKNLQDRLAQADRISGFNTWRFDLPVILGLSRCQWDNADPNTAVLKEMLRPKSNDLLRRIWESLELDPDVFTDRHRGWSLNNVASGTLRTTKIGYGGDAPRWYQAGDWGRLVNYCVDDVAIERALTDFVDRFGYVVHGQTGEVVTLD